jgi:hypothetical protein
MPRITAIKNQARVATETVAQIKAEAAKGNRPAKLKLAREQATLATQKTQTTQTAQPSPELVDSNRGKLNTHA